MDASARHVFGVPTQLGPDRTAANHWAAIVKGGWPNSSTSLPSAIPANQTKPATSSPVKLSPERDTTVNIHNEPEGEFTLFVELPKELQLKIWSHSIEDLPPRLISVRLGGRPLAPLPQLRVCSDSREVILKIYQRNAYVERLGYYKPVIVANYEVDSVFIQHPGVTLYGCELCEMIEKIIGHPSYMPFKIVVVDVQYFVDLLHKVGHSRMSEWHWPGAWEVLHKRCPNLQLATFVCNQRQAGRPGNLEDVSEEGKLGKAFGKGRRTLAYMQKQGKLTGVEMKVMMWV